MDFSIFIPKTKQLMTLLLLHFCLCIICTENVWKNPELPLKIAKYCVFSSSILLLLMWLRLLSASSPQIKMKQANTLMKNTKTAFLLLCTITFSDSYADSQFCSQKDSTTVCNYMYVWFMDDYVQCMECPVRIKWNLK